MNRTEAFHRLRVEPRGTLTMMVNGESVTFTELERDQNLKRTQLRALVAARTHLAKWDRLNREAGRRVVEGWLARSLDASLPTQI